MNIYDSSRMSAMLTALNFREVDSFREADLIIVNTCTIRDKARQKAVSFLGRLASRKRKNPRVIVAVGGCVAQHEGRALIDLFPHIDIVFGTHAVTRLPEFLNLVEDGYGPVVDVGLTDAIDEVPGLIRAGGAVSDFVTIMRGCDNFCTYCVVPHVRGRETSRRPERIIEEIRQLAASGVREVVLLGQNVNSYGNKEGLCSFPRLLAMVNEVAGIERIRFTTSHPKDLSDELIRSYAGLEKLCHHFHLPVQSGSSRILERMNRRYTRERYLERVERLRETAADIAITTDIIVGFPGETPADFEETVSLIQAVEFDGIFAFMYSDRSLAPAAKFPDKIPSAEKNRRLNLLLDLQKGISESKNSALAGQILPVLVEGPSRRSGGSTGSGAGLERQWTGRTSTNKVVNFMLSGSLSPTPTVNAGDMVRVYIEAGFAHSLSGRIVSEENNSMNTGESFHAA
ncbi:MAG: tRNA (N6-isopentenyl adenosine(37)-C2)-methylthiotransferase MiaB [Thermodesulfobacteriota bacterium]